MAPSTSSSSSPRRRGDTAQTKVFVGGLAWETPSEELHRYFEQFGEIVEAVVITDRITGRSKGYGFVTFSNPEAARRSVADPNPMINGRRANCNIASLGRPRPSPPRGRNQAVGLFRGPTQAPGPSDSRTPPQMPVPSPVAYRTYFGYPGFPTNYGHHQQALYSPPMSDPSYYHQMYSPASSPTTRHPPPPYHHTHIGYPMTDSRASFPSSLAVPYQPYIQYPVARIEQSYQSSSPLLHSTFILQPPPHARQYLNSTDSQPIPSSTVAETNDDSTDS